MKCFPSFLLILVVTTQFYCGSPPTDITQQWDKLEEKLDKGVSVLDRFIEARDPRLVDRMNIFKKDKGDLESDLNDILSDAVEILDVSELSTLKADINDYQKEIREARSKLSELRFDAEMAAAGDREKATRKIQEEEEKIARHEGLIAARKEVLLVTLRDMGIDVGEAEIDSLIYSITGDDDVQLFSVYDNIKIITERLRDATQASGESLELARRYFAMHTLLLRTLLVLQNEYVQRIDEDYIPQLEAIVAENNEIIREADTLMRELSGADRQQIESNKRSAGLTRETAQLYIDYLIRNKSRVSQSIEQVGQKQQVALHTYRTVSAAYDLVSLMNESEQFFRSLNDLQIPDLLVFENNEVREKFKELTEKMTLGS